MKAVQVGGIGKFECVNGLEPGFLPAFLKPLFFSSVFGAVSSRQDVRSIEWMSVIFMLFTLPLQMICNLCIKTEVDGV